MAYFEPLVSSIVFFEHFHCLLAMFHFNLIKKAKNFQFSISHCSKNSSTYPFLEQPHVPKMKSWISGLLNKQQGFPRDDIHSCACKHPLRAPFCYPPKKNPFPSSRAGLNFAPIWRISRWCCHCFSQNKRFLPFVCRAELARLGGWMKRWREKKKRKVLLSVWLAKVSAAHMCAYLCSLKREKDRKAKR